MDAPTLAKCACQHCGLHLEFPAELDGTTVDCPDCKQPTVLSVPPPETAAEGLTPAEVVAAFARPVPKTPEALSISICRPPPCSRISK
jgi:hypothetical protein